MELGRSDQDHDPPIPLLEESSNVNYISNEPIPQCEDSSNIYTPQVRDEDIPKIGQEFVTLDEVHAFYNNYAKEGGFSVRIHSSRRSKNKDSMNEILMKEYVCYKEGEKSVKNDSVVKKCRGDVREGCKARLRVVKSHSGPHFIVSIFHEGHNHPLATPRKVGFLRSHRHVSDVKKCLTQQFSMANIPTHQQMSILELQAGGLGNIGCTERDIRNEQSKIRKLLEGHDGDLLYEHFLSEQENNPSFRYVIEADNDGKLTHVTFSCAFLSDESTESFEWLFSQFLRFMPGPPPGMIITDQDLAIEKAIGSKLGGTNHRFCIWHIMNKFSEKLGPPTYDAHYTSFKSCIWDSESREEFDDRWLKLLETANLKEHKWLNSLFDVREKWIPAYVRHIFSAGMSSSQRAESHYSFFKKFGDKKNSLTDFIQRFNRGLGRQRHEELNDDHVNINEQPSLKTPLPMEKQMADLYTRVIFYKLQEELWQSMLYRVTIMSDDESTCIHKAAKSDGTSTRERVLVEDKVSKFISCSCKKFEFEGIPCRHLMAFFRKYDIDHLPTKYILRRWTKSAKMGKVIDDVGVEVSNACDKSLMARRTILSQLSNSIVDDVVRNEDEFERFKENLINYRATIQPSNRSSGIVDSRRSNVPQQSTYSEPSRVSFKGCGKRLKRGKEMCKPKRRKCNYCGEVGATHDKRNCPKKIIGASPLGVCGSPSESSPNDNDDFTTGIDDEEISLGSK